MSLHRRSLAMFRPLTHFLAVASYGSVSEAADSLQIAPSRISESLRYLEEVWNVSLFKRQHKRMVLTSAGLQIQGRYQQKVQALLDIVQEDIAPHAMKPLLTITAPVDLSLMLLPDAVAAFKAQYPEVEVKILATDQVVDLFANQVDLALRVGSLEESKDNNALPLLKAKAVLVARADITSKIEQHYKNGEPLPFVHFSPLPVMQNIKLNSPERTVTLKTVASADNILVCEELVCKGLGLGLFSEQWVKRNTARSELTQIGQVANLDAYVYVSWPGQRLNLGAKIFLQFIQDLNANLGQVK